MYHMYQIAVKLGYDSPRTSIMARNDECNKIIPVGCGTFYYTDLLIRIKSFSTMRTLILGKNGIKKPIVEFASNFSWKKKKKEILMSMIRCYDFNIFFFFLNKQVKIMLLFLSIIRLRCYLENITNNIYDLFILKKHSKCYNFLFI